jgi:DNA-binding LytR/AlgR family response regulator
VSFTAVVVDDELLARDELSYLLEQTGRVKVVAGASSGAEALRAAADQNPDVLFLDVQMPEMSGFDVARRLLGNESPPMLVFATAYDEYALQAFEVSAVDYLLKPFDPSRVRRAVERLEALLRNRQPGVDLGRLEEFLARVHGARPLQRLALEQNGRTVLVSPSDVLYASSAETGTRVATAQGEFHTPLPLQDLADRLRSGNFSRVHRQYLVNLERVAEFIPWPGGTGSLVLNDRAKSQVPVARTQVRRVKELLGIP